LVDKKEIKKVWKVGKLKSDSIAMCVTFLATILLPELDYAIYTGIALSIILYLRDTNKVPIKLLIPTQGKDSQIIEQEVESVKGKVDVLIIQLEGNLFFGSSEDLENNLDSLVNKAKVLILRMKYVTSIDLTALHALKVFIRSVKDTGGILIISGVRSELSSMLKKSNLVSDIDVDNIFMSEDEVFASSTNALERARTVLNCEKDSKVKSMACNLLESVSNFGTGTNATKTNTNSL